ncbi:MAG: hypothetical protein R2818_02655 [Flavobacteriales bacterium]
MGRRAVEQQELSVELDDFRDKLPSRLQGGMALAHQRTEEGEGDRAVAGRDVRRFLGPFPAA